MLEFLRKHTIVIMAAMALVFVGLVFIGDGYNGSLSQMFTKTLVSVGNQQVTQKQYEQELPVEYQMAWQLQSSMGGILDIFAEQNAAYTLKTLKTSNAMTAFAAYRGIIRNEGERLGFYANSEEIDSAIRTLPEFSTQQGEFDADTYAKFINMQGAQAREMRVKALKSIVADNIVANKVKATMVSGIEINANYANNCTESQMQLVELNVAELPIANFAPKTEPGEEQIKEFWEKNKEKYRTGEKRFFNVYSFSPLEQTKQEEAGNISNATQEVLNIVENDVWDVVSNLNGANLEETIDQAVKSNEKVLKMEKAIFSNIDKTTEEPALIAPINAAASDGQNNNIAEVAFSLSGAPNVSLNASEEEVNKAMTQVKGEQLSTTQVLDNGNVILVRLNAITPDMARTYEAAKEEAKKDLIAKLTKDNIEKAAVELKSKLAEAKTSEDFSKVAQESGAQTKNYGPYTILQNLITPEMRVLAQTNPTQLAPMLEKVKAMPIAPPKDFDEAEAAFAVTKFINPGQVAEPLQSDKGVLLVQLVKRTLEDSPQLSNDMELQKIQLEQLTKQLILKEWLKNCVSLYDLNINPAVVNNRN